MPLLYGIHDKEGYGLLPAGGWCVDTIALSENPHPTDYAAIRRDINWIVRANWGYGTTGTIPLPHEYQRMATAAAAYAARSSGANIYIIGNEINHEQERPNNVYITPEDYARCFVMCRDAIKQADQNARVVPAACAPYHANPIDWLVYWRTMLEQIAAHGGCDGLCVHAYTRSSNPADITSEAKMGPPLETQYAGFLTYRDALDNAPRSMINLPAYLTEFNELLPQGWDNENTGVVQAAYKEISDWNDGDAPKVHCLVLYRWPRYDQWYIEGKHGVIDDFRAAVARGYRSPIVDIPLPPTPTPPDPEPPGSPPGTTPAPEPARDIDPRLLARGVYFDFAKPPAGTGYWRITKAEWLDEQEADMIGPDHHILGNTMRGPNFEVNVPLLVSWPSGNTVIRSKPPQPGISYTYDYPMSSSLNEFSILANDGNASDKASGIGMGAGGNPSVHTSTWITFEWTISEGVTEPVPPIPPPVLPVTGHLIWPVTGPITQHFGEGAPRFGQQAHNGIDIAVAEGTPVLAIADGVVMFAGTDISYGLYVRVFHPAIHSHSFYAHLSSWDCGADDIIKQGQTIGHSGNTGNSTGPHLHFELRAGNRDAYYQGVTVGYTGGRYNPTDAYVVTGSPLTPGAER